jgi:acyl-CoA thioesterase FadM
MNDTLKIKLKVKRVGISSITINYLILNLDNKLVGRVKAIHVCVDKRFGEKRALAKDFKDALQLYT